jgi:hypothetical protein
MKWIVLVYLTVAVGTTEGNISYTRLEHLTKDFQECIDIEQQINDIIHRGRESKTKYVRSLYWEYKNTLGDIKAECVFADFPLPYSKKFNKEKK